MSSRAQMDRYWERRQNLLYYNVVRVLAQALSKDARSILDVGSAACPYLDWFPHVAERVSVDLNHPYDGPGVVAIKGDFLNWQPQQSFDVVMCLQVLEHVPRADLFATKLLSAGQIVIVSVPYRWGKGRTGSHIHDPVDREKLRGWFGREPNFEYLCKEVSGHSPRLIQVYERTSIRWRDLNDRARKQTRAQAGRPVARIGNDGAAPVKATARIEEKVLRYRKKLSRALRRAASRIGGR